MHRADTGRPTPNDLYRTTQDLIRSGQPVFPCRSGLDGKPEKAKAPMTKNGLHDATSDLSQVKRWWKQHGTAAIGIPTGIVWDVLDVDTKGDTDGRVHLPELNRLGLLNGCKRVVRTPSGGWHLYFKAAPGLTNKASASLGLDVRSKGGYVLAAPSYIEAVDSTDTAYAGSYEDMGETVGSNDSPLLWDLIVASLAPVDTDTKKPIPLLPSERRASVASLREWMSIRQSGERNNALHWAVCRCIDNGIDPHEMVEPALLAGLAEDEILLTVSSALRRAGLTVDDLETEGEALFPDRVTA
jgi:hypothetical protein